MAKVKVKKRLSWQSKCTHTGCKAGSVYAKINRKTKKQEPWCAEHFKSDVVEKNRAAYVDTKPAPPKPKKKKVVKKAVKR